MILVRRLIDGRYLALTEGVVQALVDRIEVHAEAGGCVAIHVDARLHAVVLLVGVDVLQDRQLLHRADHLGHPLVEIGLLVGGHGELVLRAALPPAHGDVLSRLQVQPRAGNIAQRAAQLGDHLVGRRLARAERLERHEQQGGIDRIGAAHETAHRLDIRILQDQLIDPEEFLLHRVVRNALRSLDLADQPPGILLREKSLRYDDVQQYVERQHQNRDDAHQDWMENHPAERAAVEAMKARVGVLGLFMGGAAAAQRDAREHRRNSERDQHRDDDRHRKRHGELAKQPPDDATHQQ